MQEERSEFVAISPQHLRVRRTITFGSIRLSITALLTAVGAAFAIIGAVANGMPFDLSVQVCAALAIIVIAVVDGRFHQRPVVRVALSAMRFATRNRRRRLRG